MAKVGFFLGLVERRLALSRLLSLVALAALGAGCSDSSTEKQLLSLERRYDQVTVVAEAWGTNYTRGKRTAALRWTIANEADEVLCIPSFYESGRRPIEGTVTLTSKNGRSGTVGSYLGFPSDPWDDYILVLPGYRRRIELQVPDLDSPVGKAEELSYNFSFFFCENLRATGFPSYKQLIAGELDFLTGRKFVLYGQVALDF